MSISLGQVDWEELFPVREFTLGKTVLKIKALGLEELSNVVSQLMVIKEVLGAENITLENWRSPEVLQKLSILLVNELPDLLCTMSGLATEDIVKLPLTLALSLATVCIDVNIDSAEGLVKNFKALSDKLHIMGNAIPMMMEVAKD